MLDVVALYWLDLNCRVKKINFGVVKLGFRWANDSVGKLVFRRGKSIGRSGDVVFGTGRCLVKVVIFLPLLLLDPSVLENAKSFRSTFLFQKLW